MTFQKIDASQINKLIYDLLLDCNLESSLAVWNVKAYALHVIIPLRVLDHS
jgi:hypothetical protein